MKAGRSEIFIQNKTHGDVVIVTAFGDSCREMFIWC